MLAPWSMIEVEFQLHHRVFKFPNPLTLHGISVPNTITHQCAFSYIGVSGARFMSAAASFKVCEDLGNQIQMYEAQSQMTSHRTTHNYISGSLEYFPQKQLYFSGRNVRVLFLFVGWF